MLQLPHHSWPKSQMSKLILFDFECPEHGLFEDMVTPGIHQAPCPKCGAPSVRQISAVRIDRTSIALSGNASPESVAHFDRIHREQRAKEERAYREHGDYGTAPGGGGGAAYTPSNA